MKGNNRLFVALAAVAAFSAVAWAQDSQPAPSPEALSRLSPEAAMATANSWGMQAEANKVTSYVTSREIRFEFPGGRKTAVALPQNRMVVAIAPYMAKTHACSGHYMSSCKAELPGTSARVTAVDANGEAVLVLETSTLPNGFLELWLPRDREIDVTIEARGLRATGRVSTFDGSNTCITTMRLRG